MCDNKPMAPYAKLPELEEYKEWFKDFADLYREDGILQVTWKTNDGPMHHSGMSHRAIGQLVRVLSLDFKNEIIIFTHIGDSWMTESDPNGWETYSELPTQRFQHQYFDDTNLIKNMVFDLDVPTIGAVPGPGFHWDSAFLSDVTICTEDTVMEVPHAQGGLVPGDAMGLMCQHYFGTKRGNYYMMTTRQFTAQDMLDHGMVSEVVPKGKAVERAWEIARMWKLMSYENRTIMSNLAKRPLKKLLVEDLKLHTVSEQYGSLLRVAAGDLGDEHSAQQDEKYISRVNDYRYATKDMQEPMTAEHWAGMADRAAECAKAGHPDMVFKFTSTSKISFPGSGVAAIATSDANMADIRKYMVVQTIGHDKLNQLRHVRFFRDRYGVEAQMRRHADILRPKFEMVEQTLEDELGGLEIGTWTKPLGGYFISFDALEGCAKAIVAKAKEAGVVMTGAGATFPYGKDPKDSNIRIAPSYPTVEELAVAAKLFALCVKLVSVEKILESK